MEASAVSPLLTGLVAGSVIIYSPFVTVTIPVGISLQGVAVTPDGLHSYIANRDSSKVSVIDIRNNTVAATISVGIDPIWVTVTPDGRHAYILNYGSNTVSVLNLKPV